MSVVDSMKGTDFEIYVASILRKCGFKNVQVTKKSGDYGADILAIDKQGSVVIQCKRYHQSVGVKAVQEAVSAKLFYRCNRAIVITNSTFTNDAERLAVGTGAYLWDRKELISLIHRATVPKKIESPLCRRAGIRKE